LVQDRVQCRGLVNMVMNFRVSGYVSGQTLVTDYKTIFSSNTGYNYQLTRRLKIRNRKKICFEDKILIAECVFMYLRVLHQYH
jgi:hypothetical protein